MTLRKLVGPLSLLTFGLLISAVLGEIAVRTMASLYPVFGESMREYDPRGLQIEPHGEHGYRQTPNATYHYRNGTTASSNARGYRGPAVTVPKPPGTLRVILLGGSTTHGWGVNDSQTIDTYLRADLASRFPGRAVDVVSLAFDGYDSWQDFERLRDDGLPLDPDVVVVHSGINDVRNARFHDLTDGDPRTLIWGGVIERRKAEAAQGGPTLWTRIKHWSYLTRVPGFVRFRLKRSREIRATPEIQPDSGAAAYFERNLRRIGALAAEGRFALIYSVPPSSIPFRFQPTTLSPQDYWVGNAATTQAYRDVLADRMRRVAAELAAGGQRALYLHAELPTQGFIDDCHLTPEGNRRMAAILADQVVLATQNPAPGPAPRLHGRP